jgi:hypothetical protein
MLMVAVANLCSAAFINATEANSPETMVTARWSARSAAPAVLGARNDIRAMGQASLVTKLPVCKRRPGLAGHCVATAGAEASAAVSATAWCCWLRASRLEVIGPVVAASSLHAMHMTAAWICRVVSGEPRIDARDFWMILGPAM